MDPLNILVLGLGFVLLLLIGVPISISIALSTVATLLLTMDPGPALATMAQRMAVGLDSFVLLAIPFFILSGELMGRGGMARRLVEFAKVLVGGLPGGLAFVTIVASMLFGTVSGSAVAAAAAVGGFMVPIMRREGYGLDYSAAVSISSATTGLLIPPSNILIVYSLASGGTSIGALFLAGYIPGLLVGLALMATAGIIAFRRGYPTASRPAVKETLLRFLGAAPALILIVLVIGGIVGGLFTATEASAVAVLYTFVLSVFIYREVRWREIPAILLKTASTTAVVMLLIAASMGMSWLLAYERIPQGLSAALLALSDNPVIVLVLINAVLIAAGTFMDMTPAVLIFTPIFLPAAAGLGVHPVHFGILMVLNLCIGLCTPPVGSVLFVGCGIAGTTIARVVRPLLPFLLAMIAALAAVTLLPGLSLWLPRVFGY